MAKDIKFEILRSFRNGSDFGIMKDLYPTVSVEEMKKLIHENGYADPEGKLYGDRIKKLRMKLNITQRQIGKALGIDNSTIAKIETGASISSNSRRIYETLLEYEKNGVPPEILEEPKKPKKEAAPKCTKISTKKVESESREDPVKSVQKSQDNDILSQESVQDSPESVRKIPKVVFSVLTEKLQDMRIKKESLLNLAAGLDEQIKELEDYINAGQ